MLNHPKPDGKCGFCGHENPGGYRFPLTLLPIHHAYCFTMDILKALYIGIIISINDSIMHVARNMKLFSPGDRASRSDGDRVHLCKTTGWDL